MKKSYLSYPILNKLRKNAVLRVVTKTQKTLTLSYPILPDLLTQKGRLGKYEKRLLPYGNAHF